MAVYWKADSPECVGTFCLAVSCDMDESVPSGAQAFHALRVVGAKPTLPLVLVIWSSYVTGREVWPLLLKSELIDSFQ